MTQPLNPIELAQMKKRCDEATPGPWEMLYAFGSPDLPVSIVHGDNSMTVLDWTEKSSSSCADVDFIAHSRTDIPKLLNEIERMRTELEAIYSLDPDRPDYHQWVMKFAKAGMGER